MTEEQDHDENAKYLKDFDALVMAFIHIGNLLQGKRNVFGTKNLMYAEGLSQKILQHTLAVKQLISPYCLIIKGTPYQPRIEFASIFVLTRAALETYITLNHIFTTPENQLEHEFRFHAWDMAGYLERLKYPAMSAESVKQQSEEAKASLLLKSEIENNPYFMRLGDKLQKEVFKGNWRLSKGWSDLAVNAGFNKSFFDTNYKFLCGYAHSGRLSVLQILQTKDVKDQESMSLGCVGTIMVVIAKHVYDYIELLPELKKMVNINSPEFQLIYLWKQIGENLNTGPV